MTQNLGPLIATADGGDGGQAPGPSQEPPELNINIDNTDRNRNDSRRDATGVGQGGEGSAGGNATIDGTSAD
ncbi:MAG: hypothetical protein IT338_19755 [Thermomicrobiales bacterium]|nr:hypothetical protein [Thermomicrobiales bacterium]